MCIMCRESQSIPCLQLLWINLTITQLQTDLTWRTYSEPKNIWKIMLIVVIFYNLLANSHNCDASLSLVMDRKTLFRN